MLTAIRCGDAQKVLARHCERKSGPFACPSCGAEALLVKGRLRVHHFRHRATPSPCRQGLGESAEHLACKEAIHVALQACANVTDTDVERSMGTNIADVFAVIDGVPVAIEIQRTALRIDELIERTNEYHRQGVFVLWVALPTEDLFFSEYSPRAWERWCHAMYGGRAYYWMNGETILPVHFDPCRIKRPDYIQRDTRGRTTILGGGSQVSRRLCTPNHGPRVRISAGFKPCVRAAWLADTFEIPACSLYADTSPAWWMGRGTRGEAPTSAKRPSL